jgi:hypothetical protein
MNLNVLVRSLIVSGLLSACTTRGTPVIRQPIPSGPNAKGPADSSSVPSSTATSIYQPGDVTYTYQSQARTAIEDSVPRTDSTRLTAIILAKYSTSGQSRSAHVTIMTDSVMISALPAFTPASRLPSQEFSLEIDLATGKTSTTGSTQQSCSQDVLEGPFRGDEVAPVIPMNSEIQTWADTSRYTMCRGGILLNFTRVANYRRDVPGSLPGNGASTRVLRTSDVLITGTGTQWQQAVEAFGRGTTVDTLVIQTTPPRLQRVSGTGQLEVLFKSALRSQRFIQTTTTQLVTR